MELLGFAIDTIVLAEVMSYGHELGQAVHCEIRDSLFARGVHGRRTRVE